MAAELREDYLESLAELTVASRPIIKTLTEIAQENVENAPAIVDAIEQHCIQCPPNQKLPALYLIDSICKNNGEPYTALVAQKIVPIFRNAFDVSSEPTRLKLNEQFRTWTVPQPSTNQPLFSHEVLQSLSDHMVSQQRPTPPLANGAPMIPAAPVRTGPQRLTQSGLLVEVNRLRSALEREQGDQFVDKQMQMLDRFEAQVSGVPDPKRLSQIQTELDGLRVAFEQHRAWAGSNGRRSNQRRDGRRPLAHSRDQQGHRARANRGGVDKSAHNTGSGPIGARGRTSGAAKHDLAALNPDMDTEGLESTDYEHPNAYESDAMLPPNLPGNLPATLPTGLPGAPVPGMFNGAGGSALALPPLGPLADIMMLPDGGIGLAAASETSASDHQIAQLYSVGLPLQCSTCGYRFEDTEAGRSAKQLEMDWHFRANKDIREGRSRSRCCFLTAARWIEYRDEDEVFGTGSAVDGSDVLLAGAASAASAPVDMDKEREKYVEVPVDSNVVCPVCQEPHATSWSEEAENWVWMNTVEVNGLYFHATCYADPQNKDLVASVLDEK